MEIHNEDTGETKRLAFGVNKRGVRPTFYPLVMTYRKTDNCVSMEHLRDTVIRTTEEAAAYVDGWVEGKPDWTLKK